MTSLQYGLRAPHLRRKFEAWCKDRKGATAVEFGLVAAPFFFIIFGLLELCLVFIMSTVMEHSINEAARMIRTGQAQESGFTETEFRNKVCSEFFDLLDCSSKLHIDVKSLSGFGSSNTDMPLDGEGNFDDSGFDYEPGGPNEVVAVRIFYEWDLVTPYISAPLANMAGNKHLLQANAVFRNEPFGD